jgi:hypothetical protein
MGQFLYRAATIIAGLVAVFAIVNYLDNISEGEPMVPVAALGLAAIIWLIGLCCRYLFSLDAAEIDHHGARNTSGRR